MARFDDPNKLWKISEGDIHERRYWKEYEKVYEECIGSTGSKSSPWYIVPGDNKKSARLAISQILIERFEKMKLEFPKLNKKEKKNLDKIKKSLI